MAVLRKDPKERFSATAALYSRWRPSYPSTLRDYLLGLGQANAPSRRIADIGCGTGISTRILAGPGVQVIGIDPNPEMLAEAERSTPPGAAIEYRRGEAVATGLPAASIDLVTAAQAFHWFDVEAALTEFRRILVPGGYVAAFWNLRDDRESSFLTEYDALLRQYSGEYSAVEKAESTIARIMRSPQVDGVRQVEFYHVHLLDREGLIGRAYSSSYVAHGVEGDAREAFDAALHALYDRYQRAGQVEFAYRTQVIAFRLTSISE